MKYSKFTNCKSGINYNTCWIKLLKLTPLKAVILPFKTPLYFIAMQLLVTEISRFKEGDGFEYAVVCFSLDRTDLSLARSPDHHWPTPLQGWLHDGQWRTESASFLLLLLLAMRVFSKRKRKEKKSGSWCFSGNFDRHSVTRYVHRT